MAAAVASRKRKARPLLLVGPLPTSKSVSGANVLFAALVEHLRAQGQAIRVVDIRQGQEVPVTGRPTFARLWANARVVLGVWWALLRCRGHYQTLSRSGPGLIRDILTLWPSALLGRSPLVVHAHFGGYAAFLDTQPAPLRALARAALRRVDRIVVLGELLKTQFGDLAAAPGRLQVVPNGLVEAVPPPEARVWPGPGETLHLLYLSNLIPSKGYADVLAAVAALAGRLSCEVHAHLCGGLLGAGRSGAGQTHGERLQALQERLDADDLRGRVTYHGTVLGEAKRALLRRAHVFVLPTAYAGEGQPLSLIEALAFGLPLLATRYRGIPEQLIEGETGAFIEHGRPESIVEALSRWDAEPEHYARISLQARAHYEAHFTLPVHLQRLTRLLLEPGAA